jgi:hypothetical protein
MQLFLVHIKKIFFLIFMCFLLSKNIIAQAYIPMLNSYTEWHVANCKIVFNKENINENYLEINLQSFNSGMLLLKIETKKNTFKTYKLINP